MKAHGTSYRYIHNSVTLRCAFSSHTWVKSPPSRFPVIEFWVVVPKLPGNWNDRSSIIVGRNRSEIGNGLHFYKTTMTSGIFAALDEATETLAQKYSMWSATDICATRTHTARQKASNASQTLIVEHLCSSKEQYGTFMVLNIPLLRQSCFIRR